MAALAPRLAASLYGLDILAENVEDSENNVTRFVVLSRDENWAKRQSSEEIVVTTFVFNVRNIPAALYKAMGGFATNGINMTKLESYQLGGKFVATQFYADIEGHPDDEPVRHALDELRFFSEKSAFSASTRAMRCAASSTRAEPAAISYLGHSTQSRIRRCAMAPMGGAERPSIRRGLQHLLPPLPA